MTNINKKQHQELISDLKQLIKVIEIMRQDDKSYFLFQNEREACDWLKFLEGHTDTEELESLEIEVGQRLVFKFENSANETELDIKRIQLLRKFADKLSKDISNC